MSQLIRRWFLAGTFFLAVTNSHGQSRANEEYAAIGYSNTAVDNPVARLSSRLQSGEVQLQYKGQRGYLDSLLAALNINPNSQVLVFSRTSLQYRLISGETPRALYFNDDTYVGWVQNSDIVEIATVDNRFGTVFYTFNNAVNSNSKNEPEAAHFFARSTQRCLVCHDTYGMMGGGIPLLLARSAQYGIDGVKLEDFTLPIDVNDQTPIAERWGGWYVTGHTSQQSHLGNSRLPPSSAPEQQQTHQPRQKRLQETNPSNLETLQGIGFFDTDPYLRATSDIVALLVLEHQITVQNQLTYIKFKAPVVLNRMGFPDATQSPSWTALPAKAQTILTRMLDQLVRQFLFVDAAEFEDSIRGSSQFESWFVAQGPRDTKERSLRDLDLKTRLFKYRLSYLVYSQNFDTLPAYAKDYIYRKLVDILEGRDQGHTWAQITKAERRAALKILSATKKDFVPYLNDGL